MKNHFSYTLKILAGEIKKLEVIDCRLPQIRELKFVVEVLIRGQGYLTVDPPVRIKFYDDNAIEQ